MQNEKVFWVPTLSASARHSFFMNASFEWNVLMIKVIKASMRSCLGAFGLGKVAPKLKKVIGLLLSYIWWKWKLHYVFWLFLLFDIQVSTSFKKKELLKRVKTVWHRSWCFWMLVFYNLQILSLVKRCMQTFSQVKYIEMHLFWKWVESSIKTMTGISPKCESALIVFTM